MNESYLDKVKKKREAEAARKLREQELKATTDGSKAVAHEVARQSAKSRTSTQNVKLENDNLAKSDDIDEVIKQLKEVQIASLLGGQKSSVILADSTDLGESVTALGDKIISVLEAFKSDTGKTDVVSKIADQYKTFLSAYEKCAQEQTDSIKQAIDDLKTSVDSKELETEVNVQAPNVNVEAPDLSGIVKAISELKATITANKVVIPKVDYTDLREDVASVTRAINSLQFPAPNYILPFKDTEGKGTQVQLDADGKLPISASISGADGAITDGADSNIKATVKDLTNSNPLTVAITDANGDQITSFGGGTQYTEGDTDATIVGTALMMEGAANALVAATGTAANGLDVDVTRVSGTVTVDGSGVTQPISHAALTELASAINSNLVDVNIVSGAGSGGTAAADDADFTAGTTQGTPSMGVYESTPTSVTDGDLGTVGITSGRRLKTSATIDAALPAGTNNIGDVDVLSSALPTGASTSANQSTIIGHLDGVETTLTAIDGRVDGIEALLTTIDADTSNLSVVGGGTEAAAVRVTIANNSTGVLSVDDNGGSLTVDGTVTVTATDLDIRNLTNTDVVTAELSATDNAVLDAIAASVAAIDADTTTLIGHVDGLETSNSAIQTAVQLIDDSVQVLGTDTYTEASSKGITLGAVRRDADTTLVNTTNEFTPLQVDANGRLKVEAFSGETLPVSLTSTTVTGTVAVTQSGTWDEVGINDSGNSITVDNGGTFVVQENGASLTALQIIDDPILADDGNGFTLGTTRAGVHAGIAVQTDGTDPTAVSAEGDVAALRTDMQRNLIVNQTHPRFWHVSADYASAQTNTSVKASPGASLSLYITDIVISNGATAGNITLLDGSGGTVLFEIYPAINGGATISLRSPIKLTAATALCITSTAVTTHSIFVSGYIAP